MTMLHIAAASALLLVAALLAGPRATAAQSVNVVYGGRSYEVNTTVGTSATLTNVLLDTFWANYSPTAVEACRMVNGSLGLPNDNGQSGPFFVYLMDNPGFNAIVFNGSSCIVTSRSSTDEVTFALSTDLGPEPSPSPSLAPEASPSASPSPSPGPLDCSLAEFSPPILSSRVTGQICAASRDVRRGKPSKLVTNVTLSLPGAATINITDVVTNKLTAGWQCKCRPMTRDNCTCLPNAWLLGGGNFLVMPQWRRSTRPGSIVDTTLQVSFTATAGNGDTCNGTAVICSAWGVRSNQPLPVCTPFNSTGVTRPALSCI